MWLDEEVNVAQRPEERHAVVEEMRNEVAGHAAKTQETWLRPRPSQAKLLRGLESKEPLLTQAGNSRPSTRGHKRGGRKHGATPRYSDGMVAIEEAVPVPKR
jgi:hypothetical protein